MRYYLIWGQWGTGTGCPGSGEAGWAGDDCKGAFSIIFICSSHSGSGKKKCFKMSSSGGFNWKNELQGFYFLGYCSVCPPLSYWVRPCFQCMAFNVDTPVLLTQGSPRVRSHNQKNPAKAVMKGSDCNPHTSLWNTWSLCWTVAVQTKSDHNQSLQWSLAWERVLLGNALTQ